MLKPVPAPAPDSLAARAARRAAEARQEAVQASDAVTQQAVALGLEVQALAALDTAPSGLRQLADRLHRELEAYAKAAPTIPWR